MRGRLDACRRLADPTTTEVEVLDLVVRLAQEGDALQAAGDLDAEARFVAGWTLAFARQALEDQHGGAAPWWVREGRPTVDLASTGSAGNKTPLVVAALLASGGDHQVPKASSSGGVAGTVNVLEAGGARVDLGPLDQDPAARPLCFFSQRGLSTAEARTFAARRAHGHMRQRDWVVVSILTKKLIAGCRHALLDVKVGTDLKTPSVRRAGRRRGASGDELARLLAEDAGEFCELVARCAAEIRRGWGDWFPAGGAFAEWAGWGEGFSCTPVRTSCFHFRGQAFGLWATLAETLVALRAGRRPGPLARHCGRLLEALREAAPAQLPEPAGDPAAVMLAALRRQGATSDRLLGPAGGGPAGAGDADVLEALAGWLHGFSAGRAEPGGGRGRGRVAVVGARAVFGRSRGPARLTGIDPEALEDAFVALRDACPEGVSATESYVVLERGLADGLQRRGEVELDLEEDPPVAWLGWAASAPVPERACGLAAAAFRSPELPAGGLPTLCPADRDIVG